MIYTVITTDYSVSGYVGSMQTGYPHPEVFIRNPDGNKIGTGHWESEGNEFGEGSIVDFNGPLPVEVKKELESLFADELTT